MSIEVPKNEKKMELSCGGDYETGWEHIRYEYGTSGFRMQADLIDAAVFRCGIFAALLSQNVYGGKVVGAVITASHNPVQDNGIKLVAPNGNIIDERLERVLDHAVKLQKTKEIIKYLEDALNTSFINDLVSQNDELADDDLNEKPQSKIARLKSNCVEDRNTIVAINSENSPTSQIAVGRDNRPSGERLCKIFVDGAFCYNKSTINYDFGLVTTPEMHFSTQLVNKLLSEKTHFDAEILHEAYANSLVTSFARVLDCINNTNDDYSLTRKMTTTIFLDTANGVGAHMAHRINNKLKTRTPYYELVVINGGEDELNYKCGADFVKSQVTEPHGLSKIPLYESHIKPSKCIIRSRENSLSNGVNGTEHDHKTIETPNSDFYSKMDNSHNSNAIDNKNQKMVECVEPFDSQASSSEHMHFVSFDGDADRIVYYDPKEPFVLLDGDRIASLLALVTKSLLKDSGLSDEIKLAVVQTAYANGASSEYLKKIVGTEPVFADTGVKHLHAEALKHDIAIYFEANGHGTMIASEQTRNLLNKDGILHALLELANPLVGDAFADMFLVEALLSIAKMTILDWSKLYDDLPNCLLKVNVPNRLVYKTCDAGRRVVQPSGLQNMIDACIREMNPGCRAFVRPSGTEDCVRVFAEAQTQYEADKLAFSVVEIVKNAA